MFPEMKSRETSKTLGKTKLISFPRDQTLSVLLYSWVSLDFRRFRLLNWILLGCCSLGGQ